MLNLKVVYSHILDNFVIIPGFCISEVGYLVECNEYGINALVIYLSNVLISLSLE